MARVYHDHRRNGLAGNEILFQHWVELLNRKSFGWSIERVFMSEMRHSQKSRWAYNRRVLSVIVGANLLPIVGLAVFGWGLNELLVIYWLEAVCAILVGTIKSLRAKLVTVPLPDPRLKPVLRARHGTLQIGDDVLLGYVRNVSTVQGLLFLYLFLVVPLLALVLQSSPLYYSSHETIGTVVAIAGLLVFTHLLTAKSYFDEGRYNEVSVQMVSLPSITAGGVVFGLVSVLLLWEWSTSTPVLEVWPVGLSYVVVVGKCCVDLLVRCRTRHQVERVADDVDPFEFQPSLVSVLLLRESGRKVAALPRVERPTARPRTVVRPSRSRIVTTSPINGITQSRDGAPILFLGFSVFFIVASVDPILPALTLSIAVVTAVLPVVVYTLPRHATLQYEFYDDQLVCHDYWLDEPVWALSYDYIDTVSAERGVAARIGGYATVVVETTDDRPARLPYLREYHEVVDHLERAAELR